MNTPDMTDMVGLRSTSPNPFGYEGFDMLILSRLLLLLALIPLNSSCRTGQDADAQPKALNDPAIGNPVYACIPQCTAHGCTLSCVNRRPTYTEDMNFPNIPIFESKDDCAQGCNCTQYPVGPKLPNGEHSCQTRL